MTKKQAWSANVFMWSEEVAGLTQVVEVPRKLGVACTLRERALRHELVGLVEKVVVEVVSEEEVKKGGLEIGVVTKGGRSVGGEKKSGGEGSDEGELTRHCLQLLALSAWQERYAERTTGSQLLG